MCGFSRPKLPPPPPTPAPPATQVNASEARIRERAPKAPQTRTQSTVSYSKKRGKQALRIPLQVGVGSQNSGVNVP
tara:strand:+ start:1100 stop:1327 length:228 start_codon:yes stop_codon:yes gene_type:complete